MKNKKGISAVLLIIVLLLVAIISTVIVVVVNANKEGNEDILNETIDKAQNDTNTNKPENKVEEEKEEDEEKLLESTYCFPWSDMCVDVPNYIKMEAGCTRVFRNGERKFITVTSCYERTVNDEKEAFEVLYPEIKIDINSWYRIKSEPTLTKSEVEINGIKALKVEGTVPIGSIVITDCYTYGYSFIFDGVPCAIIGVVSDRTQPQEEIDSLKEIVDAMMKTVRSENVK